MQQRNRVYVSLGSNIDPHRHLARAITELRAILVDTEISPIYQSPAVGMVGDDFLNAVIGGTTSLSVGALADTLLELESASGRVRTENKFIDRTLDLDLLLYGDVICKPATQGIHKAPLPHPEILEQAYVLQPLADIAGHVIHPTANIELSELRNRLKLVSPELFISLQQITLHP